MGPGALIHEHEQLQYLNMFIIIKWIIWLTDRGSMAAWHNPESLILRIASDGNGPLGLDLKRTCYVGLLWDPKFCTNISNITDYSNEWDTFKYPTLPQQESRAEDCPHFFRNDELCLTGNVEWMRKTVSQPKVQQCLNGHVRYDRSGEGDGQGGGLHILNYTPFLLPDFVYSQTYTQRNCVLAYIKGTALCFG